MAENRRVVVFSGRCRPEGLPFVRDPTPLVHADLVFLESTYGDRDHRSQEETMQEFHGILARAVREREKVLIPAFAIGRSQEILYRLAELVREGRLPEFPVYLDSPMAIAATRLYGKHQDLFDEEAGALIEPRAVPPRAHRLAIHRDGGRVEGAERELGHGRDHRRVGHVRRRADGPPPAAQPLAAERRGPDRGLPVPGLLGSTARRGSQGGADLRREGRRAGRRPHARRVLGPRRPVRAGRMGRPSRRRPAPDSS